MKNRDKPAMPIVNSDGFCTRLHVDLINHKEEAIGLTKREHFAGLAMQGILSNPVIMARLLEQDDVSVDTLVSSLAEVNAGSLLEALEKDNAKVMSDAVDVEQELIRLKDDLRAKAKAWDDLEALVAGNTCYVEIGNNSLSVERFYVDDPYIRYEDVTDLKEAVSSAIESIRGES
jgi:hypothetical protein